MKISIDVDCTPEEVRRLFGLPDLAPLHDVYLDKVKDLLGKGITPDVVEQMMRSWMPMGEVGMNLVSQVIGGLTGGGGKNKKS
jgi:Family of unknown function (DUF6489)